MDEEERDQFTAYIKAMAKVVIVMTVVYVAVSVLCKLTLG